MCVLLHSAVYVAGVEHVEGDMFVKVPSGNAIFLKVISPKHSLSYFFSQFDLIENAINKKA